MSESPAEPTRRAARRGAAEGRRSPTCSSHTRSLFASLAYGKLAPEARDLEQARLAIDALQALAAAAAGGAPPRASSRSSPNLQLAYADAAAAELAARLVRADARCAQHAHVAVARTPRQHSSFASPTTRRSRARHPPAAARDSRATSPTTCSRIASSRGSRRRGRCRRSASGPAARRREASGVLRGGAAPVAASPWQVLAAVNFVESDFGRMRERASPARRARCSSCRRPGRATAAATSTTRTRRSSAPPGSSGGRRAAGDERARALPLQPLLGLCRRGRALRGPDPPRSHGPSSSSTRGRLDRPDAGRVTGDCVARLCYIIARAGSMPGADFVTTDSTRGSPKPMSWFSDHAVLFALICAARGGRLRPLAHELAAGPARGHGAHAGDRTRRAGRRRGVPSPPVHDDRDRRDRPVPPARLLPQARLGHGRRLPDRRGALVGRRLHRHERRRALERAHRRGRPLGPAAGAQRRVPRGLGDGPARRRPRPARRRGLLLGAHGLARTTRRTRRSRISSASRSAAR